MNGARPPFTGGTAQSGEAIAIVGMACRYPDARSPEELWRNVLAQRRAFRRMPDERLRLEDYLDPTRQDPDSIYASFAAVIEGYEFDRERYRVAGPAYRAADLAHWLALDVAAESLIDAGFAGGEGLPRETTGVLLGNTLTGEFSRANTLRLRWPYVRRVVDAGLRERGMPDAERWALVQLLESRFKAPFPEIGEESLAGGLSNTIAGRICNHFDLKGGGYTVDGACAASLLAVTTACTSLIAGDLDVALAGGVDLSLDPFELVGFARTGALAPELMRVYDRNSAGFWPGEGCGFVVLMRADDAVARGLRSYAVIRGWGVASDGSGGITRPEAAGQLLALRRAYTRAGYGADTVGYFEGHGTGTSVGDAVELEVLSRARREASPEATAAPLGTVKANIGHTKAAAGLAGLLKATLAVHHRLLPPTTGCFDPHPLLEGAAVRVLREAESWPEGSPVRASVSAMGFGGIDTHLTLEAPPAPRLAAPDSPRASLAATPQDTEVFLFGADDMSALRAAVSRVAQFASRISFAELADLAAALQQALPPYAAARAAVIAATPAELAARLATLIGACADGTATRIDARGGVFVGAGAREPRIGLLFPGQGSPIYRDTGAWSRRFDFARRLFAAAPCLKTPDPVSTAIAQPVIVTASIVALQAIELLGIRAAVAVGHSLGELVAWHWGGALDEAALLGLAAARGRAMAELAGPAGAMASLSADAAAATVLIAGSGAVVAGLNAPGQTVISGEAGVVRDVVRRARAAGVAAVMLKVSHAFHSPLVAAAAAPLETHVDSTPFGSLDRAVISTITGAALGSSTVLRELLLRQLTSPVRFTEALRAPEAAVDLWLELGSGRTLSDLAAAQTGTPTIALDAGSQSLAGWLQAAAAAWALGTRLDHAALFTRRFVKPFDLNWNPHFFASPCEQAPLDSPFDRPSASAALAARERDASHARSQVAPTVAAGGTPLEIVRQLVAARVELPEHSVGDNHRLLGDLHLNSLVVGQIAVEASKLLGLAPPADPTAYAGATVAEMARALGELEATRGDGPATPTASAPPGVDAWTRAFARVWVERETPVSQRALAAGQWRVFAAAHDPLAAAIELELAARGIGSGIVVCLPAEPGDTAIDLLVDATRALWPDRSTGRFVVVQRDEGGGGFARSLHLESPETATCVVQVPATDPRAAAWIADEALATLGFTESRYGTDGTRREPLLAVVPPQPRDPLPLGPGDVLLVTGGGKGIAAECALAVALERGVRLGLIGRSLPGNDTILAANLARMSASGATLHYAAADVGDAAALAAAVREIESQLGTVTAVLHGAGANVPRPLSALEPEHFRATVRPKVTGLQHVLAALDASRLKLLVAFGSIIARTGLRGEADYAAANEWLSMAVHRFKNAFPNCRCRVIEWSVWSGAGMGERLGRVDALERDGITPIPLDTGVRILLDMIDDPRTETAIVVAGRFGAPSTVTLEERPLPLLRFLEQPRVHYPGIELIADTQLSAATDPYLEDHRFEGEMLLPAVMGLEALAQAVTALGGDSAGLVFEDVVFARPVIVPRGGSETVRVAALRREDGSVDLALRCSSTQYQVDHFRARCTIGLPASSAMAEAVSQVGEAYLNGTLELSPGRDLYGSALFQSGRFQRLVGYRWLTATECVADLEAEPDPTWFGPYLPTTLRLGDPGCRDAALHAVQACIPHRVLLPVSVERIECVLPIGVGAIIVRARERSHDGDIFVYDITIAESNGAIVERWLGLSLRAMAVGRVPDSWAEPLLAPYLERRLAELIPGTRLRVATSQDPGRERSDATIQRLLARRGSVLHRPDGRPEIAGDPRDVSASHANGLLLVVAGRSGVGCDAEIVRDLPDEQWRALLGADRWRLAEQISIETRESPATSRTRAWAAFECLKKAGLPLDSPLQLVSATDDGWVMLSAGSATVATYVAMVREAHAPLAFAVLAGDSRASV